MASVDLNSARELLVHGAELADDFSTESYLRAISCGKSGPEDVNRRAN